MKDAVLTADQRQAFEASGLVRLTGLIPRQACEAMADRLWAQMAVKDGIRRGAAGTWTTERPAHFKALQDSGAFAAMGADQIRAALDAVMGAGRWAEPTTWGQPLVCFPLPDRAWDVPFQNWHLDGPTDVAAPLMGRVFLILEPIEARSGSERPRSTCPSAGRTPPTTTGRRNPA